MSDPVLQWAGDAKVASDATGVPVAVLLGLTSVESGGIEGRTSRTGAGGLTQFEPGTAKDYGVDVRPGHAASQFMGAAKYLIDLGYKRDPEHALAAYNGGPGNPQYGYAADVIAAAKRYGSVKIPVTGGKQPASSATTSPSGGGDVLGGFGGKALDAALWAALATAGAVLIGLGTARATGLRQPHGAIA